MMIGGLEIIRGQGSGGSQTKVAPFWMDPYPSEIGDEMSTIENEAWVEAVALATLNDLRVSGGWPPLIEIPEGFQDADEWRAQARAAIRALAPLIIERCAEVAGKHIPKDDEWNDSASSGCRAFLEGCKFTADNISKDIRALIQKEASDGQVDRSAVSRTSRRSSAHRCRARTPAPDRGGRPCQIARPAFRPPAPPA